MISFREEIINKRRQNINDNDASIRIKNTCKYFPFLTTAKKGNKRREKFKNPKIKKKKKKLGKGDWVL